MTVETTKHFKKLTLKHPLILIVSCNIVCTISFFLLFVVPELLKGEFILLFLPFFTIVTSWWSIHSYLNCRDYGFLDDAETIRKKGSYDSNSGIQLIVAAYVVASISLLGTIFSLAGLIYEKYFI